MTAQTLLAPQARDARRAERQWQVLRFLRDELWSAAPILGEVMGIATPQGTHKALVALERESVIARASIPVVGRRPLTAWGITSHGQALAVDLDTDEVPVESYFEPSRISATTVEHHLAIQRLRIKAERAGWQEWIPGTRLGACARNEKRPDAVGIDPTAARVAVELERTIKTPKRYAAIMSGYLQAIKRGTYARVDYVCPTADLAARLQRIIHGIKAVPVKRERVALQPQHYRVFRFADMEGWL